MLLLKTFKTNIQKQTISHIQSSRNMSGKANQFVTANRLKGFDAPTVWHEFTPLANQYKAVNLGQGFPDWAPPTFIKDYLYQAVDHNLNAYARSAGHISLCEQLAKRYSPLLQHDINPLTDVVATVGSTEALFCLTQGLLQEGDEVVVFEPAFDIYLAQVQMTGATVRAVPLRVVDGQWVFDKQEFANAFNSKTRMAIINSPHNPCGKVFTKDEYDFIAETLKPWTDCVVVTDEVYEHLVYGDSKHRFLASYPGMWDRTVTMCSAGKTFSITGWKIGWVVGPEHLVKPAALAHQWVAFSISTPMQEAVAKALQTAEEPYESSPSYYKWLLSEYERKRDILSQALIDAGITPVNPQGSFFIMGDTSKINVPEEYLVVDGKAQPRDYAFCRFLVKEIGVAAIPPSAFMSASTKANMGNYARFAFCKRDETLLDAAQRLQKLRNYM